MHNADSQHGERKKLRGADKLKGIDSTVKGGVGKSSDLQVLQLPRLQGA